MCLLVLAHNSHPKYKLIFAANRDEFYDRPASQADFWKDYPNVLAGRDKQAGGTWMGITKQGRFAAITNYRNLKNVKQNAPSRGLLVSNYLTGTLSPEEYYKNIQPYLNSYNGFNLICGSMDNLCYFSNKTEELILLDNAVHGLSNAVLNTPWPKLEKSKHELQKLLQMENIHPWEVLNILSDIVPAKDEELPDTGVGLELERTLSAIFIRSLKYGTRCSSVIMVDAKNNVDFVEKTFFSNHGSFLNKEYKFKIAI